MVRRTGRSEMPHDPAATVRALRFCRDAMIDVCRTVKPAGPAYHGASMVISSIDAFATLLTGQRHYFSLDGSTAGDARRAKVLDQAARERGDTPWDDEVG